MAEQLDLVYLRVSTDEQRQGETIRGQRADAERYIAYAQLDRVAWLADDGVSGRLRFEERPAGQELLALLERRRVRTVVVTKIDRLGRSALEILRAVQAIDQAGARLVSIKEGIDLATPMGRFFLTVLAAFAEMELDLIRERTLSGKRARVASGKVHAHGGELYGYRRDKARGVREVVEAEAAVVRDLFALVAAGQSVRSVIRRLNAEGVPSPATGKRVYKDGRTPAWGTGVVHRILREPAYKGEGVEWRWRRVDSSGRRAQRPPAEWAALPEGAVPAIVDADLWERANARLATGSVATRNERRPYLLRGLVWCTCGCSMQPQPEHGKTIYRCRSRDTPSGPCGGKRAPGADLEAWVWAEAARIAAHPGILLPEQPDPEQVARAKRERIGLEAELARAERQRLRLVRLYAEADDEEDTGTVRAEMARLAQVQATIRARLEALDRATTDQQAARASMADLVAFLSELGPDPTVEERRQTLERLGVRVIANGRAWRLEATIDVGGARTVTYRAGTD